MWQKIRNREADWAQPNQWRHACVRENRVATITSTWWVYLTLDTWLTGSPQGRRS